MSGSRTTRLARRATPRTGSPRAQASSQALQICLTQSLGLESSVRILNTESSEEWS